MAKFGNINEAIYSISENMAKKEMHFSEIDSKNEDKIRILQSNIAEIWKMSVKILVQFLKFCK